MDLVELVEGSTSEEECMKVASIYVRCCFSKGL